MTNGWKPVKSYKRLKKAELEALCIDLMKQLADTRLKIDAAGGASATWFDGKLIIVHPDMPPHVWDGEKMERVL